MSQRGSASLELALGAALLVVPAVVVVLSFAPWLEARAFVRAAAAEGARAAVLTSEDPAAAGSALVWDLAAGRGFDSVGVELCGGTSCLRQRGDHVVARVWVDVALITTPWGEVGGVTVEAVHAEPVDAYRSLP